MTLQNTFETSKDTDNRLKKVGKKSISAGWGRNLSCVIDIETDRPYQTFRGFGCALTESSGYVLSFLPKAQQNRLVSECFAPNKNNYVFARTHINSCDFSLGNWSCVPQKDETLDSFSLERTDKYITPLLQNAADRQKNLSVIATPWSPPAWMKTNGDMNNGGKLKKKYFQLWADYFVRYIQGMQERGLNISHVSIQNESEASQTWDSCLWTGTEEGIFATQFLKPALVKAGLSDVKILVWDHNRDMLYKRMQKSFAVKGAESAIDGMAFHWYSGGQYENVAKVAKAHPDKELFFTEGCVEGGPRPGKWYCGERYAHNIINDLNSGCTGWIDWNMALDMQGGPNHAANYCDAQILVDTRTKEVLFQNSFYYIGHFSRFITPGSRRLGCRIRPYMIPAAPDGCMDNLIEATTFVTPEGKTVLVIMNRTEDEIVFELNFCLDRDLAKKPKMAYSAHVTQENSDRTFVCPARAIQTYVFE